MICCNVKHILEPARSYEFKKINSVNKSWQENVYKLPYLNGERCYPKNEEKNGFNFAESINIEFKCKGLDKNGDAINFLRELTCTDISWNRKSGAIIGNTSLVNIVSILY